MMRYLAVLCWLLASVSFGADGDLLGKRLTIRGAELWVDGRPVYLTGAWVGNTVSMDPRLYKPDLDGDATAYSQLLSAATAPELGITSAHPPMSSLRALQATGLMPVPSDRDRRRWDGLQAFVSGLGGLPIVVDCAGTKDFKTTHLPAEWRQVGPGWHGFVPLCPERPDTWKLYLDYWRDCAQQIVDSRVNAVCYELFNEPAYNCRCIHNKHTFAQRMRECYGTIERANERWGTGFAGFDAVAEIADVTETPGLWCDWSAFIGDRYTEILVAGRGVIQEVDTRQDLCFLEQPAITHTYLRCNGIDPVKVSRTMDIIGMEGGVSFGAMQVTEEDDPMAAVLAPKGLFAHQLYLDMARAFGKPVINTETYCGRFYSGVRFPSRRTDIQTELWEEMIHGASGSQFYNWGRRWWEWKDMDGAKHSAREVSYKAFSMLNPYAFPAESLQGFADFQRDLDRVGQDLLAGARIQARVALLVSQPTARQLYRQSSYTEKGAYETMMRSWYAALTLEQIALDVVWEEQLATADLSAYNAILAPMAQYVYAATLPALANFTKQGGRVIATADAFQFDEYGGGLAGPLPPVRRLADGDWRVALPRALLRDGDFRDFRLVSADGQAAPLQCEAYRIRRPGKDYIYVVNWETAPRLVRLHVQDPAGAVVTSPLDDAMFAAASLAAAGTLIHLPSQVRTLMRMSGSDPMPRHWSEADVRAAYAQDLTREQAHLAGIEAELAAARQEAEARQVLFDGPTTPQGEYLPDDATVVLLHGNGVLDLEPLTNTGAVTFTEGKLGAESLHIGADGNLLFPMPGSFDPDQGTIELWVRPDWPVADGKRHIMVDLKGPGAWNQNRFTLYKNKNYEISFVVYGREQKSVGVKLPINILRQNQWTHLCLTWNRATGLCFYVDGELKQETKASFHVERIDTLCIGSNGEGDRYWNGRLDELRISRRVRTRRDDAEAPQPKPHE